MGRNKKSIPQYGTVKLNGIEYYRTRIEDADEKELRSMQRPQRNFMKKLKKPNAKSKMRCSADQLPPWRNTVRNG